MGHHLQQLSVKVFRSSRLNRLSLKHLTKCWFCLGWPCAGLILSVLPRWFLSVGAIFVHLRLIQFIFYPFSALEKALGVSRTWPLPLAKCGIDPICSFHRTPPASIALMFWGNFCLVQPLKKPKSLQAPGGVCLGWPLGLARCGIDPVCSY